MVLTRSAVQRPGDRAWLISRVFNVTFGNPRCLTFWFVKILHFLLIMCWFCDLLVDLCSN